MFAVLKGATLLFLAVFGDVIFFLKLCYEWCGVTQCCYRCCDLFVGSDQFLCCVRECCDLILLAVT